jgi:hypothetical protein
MQEVFVKKEKLLEPEYVKILSDTIQVRKGLEHGTLESISGKKVDQMLTDSKKYLKRISKLFTQIEEMKEKEKIKSIYDDVITITRDVIKTCGVGKIAEKNIVDSFKESAVSCGNIPNRFIRSLKTVVEAKKSYDEGKLSKAEIENVKKVSGEYVRHMVEYLQRQRGAELERAKIRFKYGDKFGEVILLENHAYIIHDVDGAKELSRAELTVDGGLKNLKESTLEELEKDLLAAKIPKKVFIKQPIFDDLKKLFGKNVEVLLTY